MAEIGSAEVQCPICEQAVVLPVTASLLTIDVDHYRAVLSVDTLTLRDHLSTHGDTTITETHRTYAAPLGELP